MAAMKEEEEEEEEAHVLQSISNFSDSPNGKSRRRRRSGGSSGGSFEFCVLRKPNLLSADQLFSDGVLLPLYRLPTSGDMPETNLMMGSSGEEEKTRFAPEWNPPDSSELQGLVSESDRPDLSAAEQPELVPESDRRELSSAEQRRLELETDCPGLSLAEPPGLELKSDHPVSNGAEQPELGSESGPGISATVVSSSATSSKRWRDIFKRAPKGGEITGEKTSKEKKGGIFAAHAAERVLNINLWPFRRSNSAGNGGSGAPPAGAGLTPPRVSSAPCSPAEFNFKKLPIPRKGRSNATWPARRSVSGNGARSNGLLTKSADKVAGKDRNHGEKGCTTKEGGNKGWGKVSPAASDGGDWYKARVLTMKASMCTDASGSGSGSDGGFPGVGRRSNLRTLFANKIYEI